ncbi:pyridoxal phosphate-dependent transferase [Clohesyomyces aquaticus]|uniref:Pyridoxal phosphate-dependent transferase n=1 Tax=Clohesyomyces aquaticus TaxID=1231657 RepID=A0A1Y1Y8U2_9PLEO|nr:pyridoxal phosphate-dependent transferase [Clohesyomyces aquaticus]
MKIYPSINESELKANADSCLLTYGSKFHPDIITRAKGVYIYTASGQRMLDWTSGQMSCLIGHGNPEIVDVITKHAASLDHLFSGMLSPPVISLAKRLTDLTPKGLDKAFFLSTGGESNEAAIRLAKFYTGKFEIVGLSASWHGMVGAANGAQYHSGRAGYGPVFPGNLCLQAPNAYRSIFRHPNGTYDWETELDYGFSLIDRQSCGSLAAVIVEPILSSAGMHPLPAGYLTALKAHCEHRGMLLICDEAQTAIGRAGDMFAFQHYGEGVVPDILTLSKTLGNGLPLSAVVTSDAIAACAKDHNFTFYTTHVNDPIPAAVGDKVLEVVVRDRLVERSRELGSVLHAGLRRLQQQYGCIGDVRCRGLMAGVEIVADRRTKAPGMELGDRIGKKMTELGLWAQLGTMQSFSGVFRIAPPITISEKELEEGLTIMEKAFASVEGTMSLYGRQTEMPVLANL